MQGTRKVEGRLNCGEVREIAAHSLCFKCYRREDRAKEQKFAGTDRHNPGLRKEHKKMFRGFASAMGGLSDLGVAKRHPHDSSHFGAISRAYSQLPGTRSR